MRDWRPPDTSGDWEGGLPKCPWCASDVDDATVRLEDLMYAFHCGELRRPRRDTPDEPNIQALRATCPSCERPFLVALREEWGFPRMRLLAARTPADNRLLQGEGRADEA